MRKNLKIFSIIIITFYFGSLFIDFEDKLIRDFISLIFGIFIIPLAVYEMKMLYEDDRKNGTKTFRNRLILMVVGAIFLIINMIYWNFSQTP